MKKRKLQKKAIFCTLLSFFAFSFLSPLISHCQESELPVFNGKYKNIVQTIAAKYQVPLALVKSIIHVESNFNHLAVSVKGAMGLMQLMPTTAKKYGVKNAFNPEENIEGGVKYLNDLMKTYKSQTNLVLAAYNAGEEAVNNHKGVPPFPETIDFIRRVKKYYDEPYIREERKKTQIYMFYDSSGKLTITDNARLRAINSDVD